MSFCRTSVLEDIPRLKELWKSCFGDEDSYIDHYFQTFYAPDRALVLEVDGVVTSMLLTFPETVVTADGRTCPACYIYAFCTQPDLQGRGYGRMLLTWAEDRAGEAGCAAVLMVPGEKSLFRFYETLGYTVTLSHREVTWPQNALPVTQTRLNPISWEEYQRERRLWLSGLERIDPAGETLAYQQSLCRFTGGNLYRLSEGIAAVELWEDTAEVKELLCADWKSGAAAICAALGVSGVHVYLPPVAQEGELVPFCVVKPLRREFVVSQRAYFAFGLD